MNFLNSLKWRKFQESVGRKTFDLGKGYMIKLDMPFGKNYLYSNYLEAVEYIDEIKKIGRAEGAIFFKYEPMVVRAYNTSLNSHKIGQGSGTPLSRVPDPIESDRVDAKGVSNKLQQSGFKKSPKSLQPQQTIVLNLIQDEEEILAGMHQKTRYNIGLAEKRGIKVNVSKNKVQDFESFWNLLQETAKHDNFHTHTKDYYKKLLDLKNVELFLASMERDQIPLAVAIIIFYKKRATYLHGASNYEYRRDMAPYLLHWQIICDAKARSIEEYDFWGINERKWPGVTRFKRGFLSVRGIQTDTGREIEYIGSWDYIFKPAWYILYRMKNKF